MHIKAVFHALNEFKMFVRALINHNHIRFHTARKELLNKRENMGVL